MRRIAHSLAVAGAIAGLGLSALPAGASTLSASRAGGSARAAQASPTPVQRQAARTAQAATIVKVSAAKVTTGIDTTLPRG
jgi:hypothetical protein